MSERTILQPGDPGTGRGVWRKAEEIVLVVISCPLCGKQQSMGRQPDSQHGSRHTIAPDGTVHPSCVCPFPPCTWHVWAQLAGWPG